MQRFSARDSASGTTRQGLPAGLLPGFKVRPDLRRTPQILKKILFALLPD
jgi:hypothetical protein